MHTGKFTKITATIGPASESEHIIYELIRHGVNVFRFNTKHNTNDWHASTIKKVKHVAKNMGVPVGILVDLQGPEIRIETYEAKPIQINPGDLVPFINVFEQKDSLIWNYELEKCIRIPQKEVFSALEVGNKFSIDDGFMDFEVTEVFDHAFIAKALEGGLLKTRKGLNLVGKDVDLPSLTETDKQRISMAAEMKADFMGLSFVRSKRDIEALREEMLKYDFEAKIIAKVESQKGVDNIDEIIESADAVMVARGDLGIEVPIEQMTGLQKEWIKKCRNANKPVIVATQMLQSMVDAPRPTRAEAADVSNAIYDETDCIMLSGETATGSYPIKAVDVMSRIARYNEIHKPKGHFKPVSTSQTHVIAEAAMSVLEKQRGVDVKCIVAYTETGHSARVISSFRPDIPVIAVSENRLTLGSLNLSFGVTPVHYELQKHDLTDPTAVIAHLVGLGLVKEGHAVLFIHGSKYKEAGTTNSLVLVNA